MPNTPPTPADIYRIRVAVPVHLYDCFDYTLTAEQYRQAEVGARVAVSFGRQNLVGIIVEKLTADTPIDPRFKLKAITELLDEQALLDQKILSLLTWSAQYYQFPIGEVFQSPFVDDEHALAVVADAFLFVAEFAFLDLDVVFLCQITKSIVIGELLMLHDEMDGSAAFTACKAFADVLRGRDIEGGRLVVMEGTKSYKIDAAPTQCDEVRDDVNDVRCVQNPVYGRLVYHALFFCGDKYREL